MTQVITMPSPRAAASVDGIARQQCIENALSIALHLVRQPGTTSATLHAATARAVRAATLLKHACESVNSQLMEG